MKKLFLISVMGFFAICSKAQPIDSVLSVYGEKYQPEKAYLHYDKSSYYPGETIWFKAYLMEGIYPGTRSRTLYVDWISPDGKVLMHTVAPLVDAATNGQFDIPAGYTGNVIHVRAYTRWMLNFDTAFLYNREIRVLSSSNAARGAKPAIIPSLQVFPEAGDLIQGVANCVAFKATDQWGRPVKVKGLVRDKQGNFVDSLRTQHDGMGSFNMLVQPNATYAVYWKDEKGGDHATPLPPAKTEGVAMQVTQSQSKRTINFQATQSLPATSNRLHLIGTIGGSMAFRTDIPMTAGGSARRIIDTKALPTGILTLTLFDDNWKPLAERVSFVNNHDFKFEPSFEVEHWGLGKRKRNVVLITLPDSIASSSVSVSVTDAAIERDTTENIYSQFLLTSDLRGKVFNPAFYFLNSGDSVDRYLDLVMLTNGWRRFKWEEVTQGKYPVISNPRDTAFLTVSGQLYGVSRSQLSGKESIVLMVKEKDSASKMMIMPVSQNGTFGDPSLLFFDTLQVYYSLKSKFLGQAEARFMVDRLSAPDYTSFVKNLRPMAPLYDTAGTYYHMSLADREAMLRAMQTSKVMETVVVKTKQKTPEQILDEKYASGLFQGDAYQFDLVNSPTSASYGSVLNYLQGKVAGLQIMTSGGQPSLTWRGGAPALYIDQLESDAQMVNNLPIADIAYVKVFRPPFMGGFGGANGAIAIYTRRGDDAKNAPSAGLTANRIMGYTPIREFYSPNYDNFTAANERPDSRTTLYWNPVLVTEPGKKQLRIVFYNNDLTKAFRVTMEGMSKEGLLMHSEQIME